MADFELDTLSLDELRALKKDVEKTIETYEVRRRNEALVAVEAIAREAGFSLNDLVTGSKKKSAQRAKYKHPENPELTWSGRGRQPVWFKELLGSGMDEAEMRVSA
ncbi:MAG: H-NS histone family protein [Pseudomonadota bacterium]